MYLGFATGNVIQKFIPDIYNIIYYPQNNLFDYLIGNIAYNYYILVNKNQKCFIDNMAYITSDMVGLYNYNLSITNNILGYTTNNIKHFHINSLIFTHSHKPEHIKKEDSVLMDQRLTNEHKIFFSESSRQTWRLTKNTYVYNYGIPTVFEKTLQYPERKNVLILDLENTTYAKHVYQLLKNAGVETDIINTFDGNMLEINQIYNKYKICIDLAEHNIINLLCAVGSGCHGITIKNPMLFENYKHVNGIEFANNIDNIVALINSILNNPDNDSMSTNNSIEVKKQYDYDSFEKMTRSIIEKANNEAFVL